MGLHDRLAQKDDRRADLLHDLVHHLKQRVHLRMVHAPGSDFLPHIRDCIQPEDIDAFVCQRQQHFHNLVEHLRIGIIQIPLKFIETGHHILVQIRIPGEISRRNTRKNLRHRLFIFLRDPVIVEHVIHIVVIMISLFIFLYPDMLLRRMVQHKIDAGADSAFL